MLFQRMKGSYHSVGDYNLFTVDWERLAMSPWYNTAAKNTKLVGRRTALLVEWLVCATIVLLYFIGRPTFNIAGAGSEHQSGQHPHHWQQHGGAGSRVRWILYRWGKKLMKYN